MNASLRIALAYFSFVSLQKWLNWICGAMLVTGLVMEMRAESSYSLGGGIIVSMLATIFIAVAPLFAGGLVMRIASPPTILHLRPRGRIHMLAGATLAVTIAAALLALPMLVAQLTGIRIPSRSGALADPGLGMFQFMWGGAALTWIIVFAMSRYQSLAALSFILVVGIVNVTVRSASHLPVSADLLATIVFATGVAAWISFALWYTRTPSVRQPGWISGWARGQPAPELIEISNWRGFRWPLSGSSSGSRSIALHQHLIGTDSITAHFLIGVIFVAFLLLVPLFSGAEGFDGLKPSMLLLLSIISGIFAGQAVRRSRMLWLRAGLDRAGLFVTAERQIWRATLALFILPGVLVISLPVALRSLQILDAIMFVVLQLTLAACFLYAGLNVTRGWNAGAIAVFTILVVPLGLITSVLAPGREHSMWAFVIAIPVFGTLAIVIRGFARRAWLVLDWRLAGPPLPRQGIRGN